MPVLLSTYGPRGDLEPKVGLAVRLRALGAELLARVGAPLVPVGQPVHGATPPSAALSQHAPELVAAQFDAVVAAAEGCGASAANGVMPAGVLL